MLLRSALFVPLLLILASHNPASALLPSTWLLEPEVPFDARDALAQKYLAFYATPRGRPIAVRALQRSSRYRPFILSMLTREGLPSELSFLPLLESEFNPRATSRSGAVGLWQLMPKTARDYGLEVSDSVDERYNPAKSTRAALRYLKDLRKGQESWFLALSAYNCGKSRLRSAMSGATELPDETRQYVPRFIAAVLAGRDLLLHLGDYPLVAEDRPQPPIARRGAPRCRLRAAPAAKKPAAKLTEPAPDAVILQPVPKHLREPEA